MFLLNWYYPRFWLIVFVLSSQIYKSNTLGWNPIVRYQSATVLYLFLTSVLNIRLVPIVLVSVFSILRFINGIAGRWFSPGTPVFSTNKTDLHKITEILLKGSLSTHNFNPINGIARVVMVNYFVVHYCLTVYYQYFTALVFLLIGMTTEVPIPVRPV